QRPGVFEKNIFATNAAGYSAARAWLLTAAGAVVLGACILFAVRNSARVEETWLRHPVRSFGKFYLNPWSTSGLGVSPLHMLSFAIAFLLLRMIAAANNLSVYMSGFGPVGELIKAAAAATSPGVGFCIVAFSLFLVALIIVSPLAARLITSWRSLA
ncbi:MAG: hypothetical protein ABR589_13580, partial [Chthoniobacterales bacterium]